MGNIILLDDLTINKIAAGEVIERPASVVKEMVENSIDAGATKIVVETKNGGISYIKITDNGKGILHDDVEMAFERHATSKIKSAKDLDTVSSMGFRGEALASIASVAKVTLKTKATDEKVGSYVRVESGEILEHKDIGFSGGTQIEVCDLFYNIPARYKFLKKDATEQGYIFDTLTNIALIHPEIAIKYTNQGKKLLQTTGNGKLRDVVYSIYGKDVANAMIDINCNYDGVKITGLIGKPEIARSNKSRQIYFVNGRVIKDVTIAQAIAQAYKGIIPIGKFASCILSLEVNNLDVDVNVHPAKLEVRFSNPNLIFQAIYHSVKNTLLKENLIAEVDTGLKEEKRKSFEERLEEKLNEKSSIFNKNRKEEDIEKYVEEEAKIKTNSYEEDNQTQGVLEELKTLRQGLDSEIKNLKETQNKKHFTYKPEKTLSSLDFKLDFSKNKNDKNDNQEDKEVLNDISSDKEDNELIDENQLRRDIEELKGNINIQNNFDIKNLDKKINENEANLEKLYNLGKIESNQEKINVIDENLEQINKDIAELKSKLDQSTNTDNVNLDEVDDLEKEQTIEKEQYLEQDIQTDQNLIEQEQLEQDVLDKTQIVQDIDQTIKEPTREEISQKVDSYISNAKATKYDKYLQDYYQNKKEKYDKLLQEDAIMKKQKEEEEKNKKKVNVLTQFTDDEPILSQIDNQKEKQENTNSIDEYLKNYKRTTIPQSELDQIPTYNATLKDQLKDQTLNELSKYNKDKYLDMFEPTIKERFENIKKIDEKEKEKIALQNTMQEEKQAPDTLSQEEQISNKEQLSEKEQIENEQKEIEDKEEKLKFLDEKISQIEEDPNNLNDNFKTMYEKLFGTKIKTTEELTREEKARREIEKQKGADIFKNISMFDDEPKSKIFYKFVGIFFKTYIIIEIEDEIYIIDQHAAHERINYEKVKEIFYSKSAKDSQMLLMPDIIELTTKEYDIAKDNWKLFEQAGFTLEEFGDNVIKLTGCPTMCLDLDTKSLFLDILDEINTVARTAKQELEEKFIATVACKASVKAKMALDETEVKILIDKLLSLPNPFSCPHGRPTAIKMSKGEIEKKFSRT